MATSLPHQCCPLVSFMDRLPSTLYCFVSVPVPLCGPALYSAWAQSEFFLTLINEGENGSFERGRGASGHTVNMGFVPGSDSEV